MKRVAEQFWALCRPFWGNRRSWQGWLLIAVIVAMGGTIVWLNVLFNSWTKSF